jgi:hypothetical protein
MGLNSRSDRNLRPTLMGDDCNLSVTRRSPKSTYPQAEIMRRVLGPKERSDNSEQGIRWY